MDFELFFFGDVLLLLFLCLWASLSFFLCSVLTPFVNEISRSLDDPKGAVDQTRMVLSSDPETNMLWYFGFQSTALMWRWWPSRYLIGFFSEVFHIIRRLPKKVFSYWVRSCATYSSHIQKQWSCHPVRRSKRWRQSHYGLIRGTSELMYVSPDTTSEFHYPL